MRRRIAARLLAAALPTAPALVLLVFAPPQQLVVAWGVGLHARDGGPALLVATAALFAWAVVAWLALGVLVAVCGAAPGAAGRVARRVGRWLTPALVRSLLSGGTAVGLALTPLLPGSAQASSACAPPPSATALPSLDRPAVRCPTPAAGRDGAAPAGAAPRSSPARSGPARSRLPQRASTSRPAPRPGLRGPRAARLPQAAGSTRTVVRGDSLWSLASAELRAAGLPATDAAIARRWPAWWQANRTEVGADPDLIYPGEVLRAPRALTPQETP